MKINRWKSLRTKIIAWSFVPTVIILSAVAWFTIYSYQKVIGDQAIKQDMENVQEIGTQALVAINNKFGPILLPIFLEIDARHEGSLTERAEKILSWLQQSEAFDGGIYFLDQQGKVFITDPEQPELMGQDWSDTPQFRYLQEHNNVTVATDLLSIGSSGKKVVCSVIAMLGQKSDTVGSIYMCYSIYPATRNMFYQALNDQNLGSNVYVLDGNQQVIYSPVLSKMGNDLSGDTHLQQLLHGESRSGRFRIRNKDMLVSYATVVTFSGWSGWVIIKEQSWAEIMQPTLPYRQLLYILLALGVIVPVLVTAYGVRHITNPIQKLIKASEQVTAGQFKHRIEVKTGDEIETLANQFNLMSAELDESYSSLEKKVADRTRELAIINAILSVASRSLDIQEILADALNILVEQMGFETGAAFKLESDQVTPTLVSQRGIEPTTARDIVMIDPIKKEVNPVDHPSRVTTFEIRDIPDEKLGNELIQSNCQLLVYVPLSTKGRDLGFFLLGKREANPLSPEELTLLSSIGQQIGVAVEIAQLYERAEQTAITAERSRLARELHDAVTQTLFSANLIADVIPRIWKRNPEEGLQNLEELRQLTRGALAEMRTLLLEMRPESLERADIKSLLTQLADAFIGRVRVPVSLDIQGNCELTQDVKIVFYRIAQEALNNIAKHSGARQVDLNLKCQPGQMILLIKDDGLGFDPNSITPEHLGIAIMRERANSIGANLKIESQVGQGTTIEVDWRSASEE
jgi:nitrate/nitrite-specific signal transduction histidine kinase